MVDYDPHHWRSHLLDIRGSTIREISPRVVAVAIWSIIIVGLHLKIVGNGHVRGLAIDPTAHSLVGVVLGLLLVFRTNSSYDRFWEGRKLWGGIVNETRNLARSSCIYLQDDPAVRDRIVCGAIAFAYAAMYQLRRTPRHPGATALRFNPAVGDPPDDSVGPILGPLDRHLPAHEKERLLASRHLPLAVAIWITGQLRRARDAGLISDYVMVSADQNVQLIMDYIGGCERIHNTPMPYAYMVHARRALILYCGTLPFALVGGFGWLTIPAVLMLSFLFLGIEEIGVEIEDPFGRDENDLPLERICQTIEANLLAQIELENPHLETGIGST